MARLQWQLHQSPYIHSFTVFALFFFFSNRNIYAQLVLYKFADCQQGYTTDVLTRESKLDCAVLLCEPDSLHPCSAQSSLQNILYICRYEVCTNSKFSPVLHMKLFLYATYMLRFMTRRAHMVTERHQAGTSRASLRSCTHTRQQVGACLCRRRTAVRQKCV